MNSLRFSSKILLLLIVMFYISQQQKINQRILQQTPPQTETEQQKIKNQILNIAQQKQQIAQNRSTLISQITSAINSIKQLQPSLYQPKIDASAAYTNYYNAKIACDSYTSKLDIIGRNSEVTNEECFQVPIAPQANNLYIQKAQLDAYASDVSVNQDVVDLQVGFASDVFQELQVFQDLKTYFTNRNQTIYNTYFNQAFSSQNSQVQQSQIATSHNQALYASRLAYNSTILNIQAAQSQLASQISTCTANVANLKAILEQKLAAVNTIYLQIQAFRSIINDGLYQLDIYSNQLKSYTYQLDYIATNYRNLYPTQSA